MNTPTYVKTELATDWHIAAQFSHGHPTMNPEKSKVGTLKTLHFPEDMAEILLVTYSKEQSPSSEAN
jgi:hypothetical protein